MFNLTLHDQTLPENDSITICVDVILFTRKLSLDIFMRQNGTKVTSPFE